MRARHAFVVFLATMLAAPGAAVAAAPPNDAPATPAAFESVAGQNGNPDEQQGIAQLREATADAGVPRCLGAGSFDRTVWFRIPPSRGARELDVEASGRTTSVLDLAAFVQPPGSATDAPAVSEPNACAGAGAGAADASVEPTAGVVLRVPADHAVLIQVGRRGAPGSAEDEEAVLSLDSRVPPDSARPTGDDAGQAPAVGPGTSSVIVGGATITPEDPATPRCPAAGSVWRRVVPSADGPVSVAADGSAVGTLTVFAGERPAGENAVDCVNREKSTGPLRLDVAGRAGRPLWIRLGTDRPSPSAVAELVITGALGPVPAAAGRPGTAAASCTVSRGLRSATARRRGRRLKLAFSRRTVAPVTVDVFQQSAGRRVLGERLVARFARRSTGPLWNGRANRRGRRVSDGIFVVRFRQRTAGGTDTRRLVLRRERGRYRVLRAYARSESCALLGRYKLSRPVFGGRTNRELSASFRVAREARATLVVLRGRRVVRRFPTRSYRPGRTNRIRFDSERRPRGDYRFRLTVRAGGETVTSTLTSRRL